MTIIKNRFTMQIIVECKTSTLKELVIKSKADLSGADLSGADLSRANLSGADLSGADLSRANLYGANLYGVNLYGADLSRANLSRADLSGAKGIISFIAGAALAVAYMFKGEFMLKIGCKVFTVAEWKKNYKTIGKENNYTQEQIEQYGAFIKALKPIKEVK